MKTLNISTVSTAQRVGVLSLTNKKNKKWEITWMKELGNLLKDKSGRVYLIVVNGIIYKIGGSVDKKGILGTMGWYENSALSGAPSARTHGIHMLVYEELKKGNNVEVYMILSTKVEASVKGLFGEKTMMVSIDFKEMENLCKNDYFSQCGSYPQWNFQENNQEFPKPIVESWNEVINKSAANRKK